LCTLIPKYVLQGYFIGSFLGLGMRNCRLSSVNCSDMNYFVTGSKAIAKKKIIINIIYECFAASMHS